MQLCLEEIIWFLSSWPISLRTVHTVVQARVVMDKNICERSKTELLIHTLMSEETAAFNSAYKTTSPLFSDRCCLRVSEHRIREVCWDHHIPSSPSLGAGPATAGSRTQPCSVLASELCCLASVNALPHRFGSLYGFSTNWSPTQTFPCRLSTDTLNKLGVSPIF